MDVDRIARAFKRIEDALYRIEYASAVHCGMVPAVDPELAVRHEVLRATVRAKIAELDVLIDRLEN